MNAFGRFYAGRVLHRRLRPARHVVRHDCYWMLIDIDRIAEFADNLRLFSHNRFNIMGYRDGDHGTSQASLRPQIEAILLRQKIDIPDGVIRMFCMPRILGYGFNPISIFFCHDRNEALKAVVYEVHNTFGERHFYPFPVDPAIKTMRHFCDKDFYVSPFMDMDLRYDFRLTLSGESIELAISTSDSNGLLLFAGLSGEGREMTDRSILQLCILQPLVTLKVIAAIHIHAVILWWKGVGIRRWRPGLRNGRHAPLSDRDPKVGMLKHPRDI